MCRFLLAKSKTPTDPRPVLESFALMAEKSKAYDGDWQGDGWGIAFLDGNNEWKEHKSLNPVWKDKIIFSNFPKTTMFSIHARSASFADHKGLIEFNQPYIDNHYIFVFNGLLKGVSLSPQIPGKIGSQKIWFILRNILNNNSPEVSLQKIKKILEKSSKEIQALNIGLSDKKNIYVMGNFTKHEDYYGLWSYKNKEFKLVCSASLPDYNFQRIPANKICAF